MFLITQCLSGIWLYLSCKLHQPSQILIGTRWAKQKRWDQARSAQGHVNARNNVACSSFETEGFRIAGWQHNILELFWGCAILQDVARCNWHGVAWQSLDSDGYVQSRDGVECGQRMIISRSIANMRWGYTHASSWCFWQRMWGHLQYVSSVAKLYALCCWTSFEVCAYITKSHPKFSPNCLLNSRAPPPE